MRKVLTILETIQLSRLMEERALTPDRKAYKEGWYDERVTREFNLSNKESQPINEAHVAGMRRKVYNIHVVDRAKSNLNTEILKVLSEVPGIRSDVNQQEAWTAFRLTYNKWANDLRQVCKK